MRPPILFVILIPRQQHMLAGLPPGIAQRVEAQSDEVRGSECFDRDHPSASGEAWRLITCQMLCRGCDLKKGVEVR